MFIKNLFEKKTQLGEQWFTRQFMDNWLETMVETMSYNHLFQTFTIANVEEYEDGFYCIIHIPYGLTLDQFVNAMEYIEEKLDCTFDIAEIDKFRCKARFTFEIEEEVPEEETAATNTPKGQIKRIPDDDDEESY
jgi:hypothetical protein